MPAYSVLVRFRFSLSAFMRFQGPAGIRERRDKRIKCYARSDSIRIMIPALPPICSACLACPAADTEIPVKPPHPCRVSAPGRSASPHAGRDLLPELFETGVPASLVELG